MRIVRGGIGRHNAQGLQGCRDDEQQNSHQRRRHSGRVGQVVESLMVNRIQIPTHHELYTGASHRTRFAMKRPWIDSVLLVALRSCGVVGDANIKQA